MNEREAERVFTEMWRVTSRTDEDNEAGSKPTSRVVWMILLAVAAMLAVAGTMPLSG